MIKKESTLWVDRYRPTRLENFVGNEVIKNSIKKQLEINDIQNYLFYGPAGTGKTTLAKIIVDSINCDFLYINASDERGIETIREKVMGFASQASLKPLKVVILDESDYLTINAQASLRNVIETFSRSTRFILTCNYVERMIDPIQSRCQVLKLEHDSAIDMAKHLVRICQREKVESKTEDIKSIVAKYFPDLRKMINTLQSNTTDGVLKLDEKILVSSNYVKEVVKELAKTYPNKDKWGKKFNTIRQIINNSGSNDYEELYKYLYEKSSDFAPEREGTVAVLINEHLYKRNFKINQEICVMSLIQQLIENK